MSEKDKLEELDYWNRRKRQELFNRGHKKRFKDLSLGDFEGDDVNAS